MNFYIYYVCLCVWYEFSLAYYFHGMYVSTDSGGAEWRSFRARFAPNFGRREKIEKKTSTNCQPQQHDRWRYRKKCDLVWNVLTTNARQLSVKASRHKHHYAAICFKNATDARFIALGGAGSAVLNTRTSMHAASISRWRWRARPAFTHIYLCSALAVRSLFETKVVCIWFADLNFGEFVFLTTWKWQSPFFLFFLLVSLLFRGPQASKASKWPFRAIKSSPAMRRIPMRLSALNPLYSKLLHKCSKYFFFMLWDGRAPKQQTLQKCVRIEVSSCPYVCIIFSYRNHTKYKYIIDQ